MPFDMVGEHAQEDVGAHPLCGPVADRPDFEIDGFDRSEGAFDAGQIFVGLDRFASVEVLGRDAGPDDIDAVEAGLFLDPVAPALEGEMAVADIDGEVLGHFSAVQRAAAMPISAVRGERPCADLRLDASQLALGRANRSSRLRVFPFAIAKRSPPPGNRSER
jgi:hypothetical protein